MNIKRLHLSRSIVAMIAEWEDYAYSTGLKMVFLV